MALLVDQAGGFEHVKRRHYLFVADRNELDRAWTGEEGAGPTWSAAIVVDGAQGQEIVYLTAFRPGAESADTLRGARYGWDEARNAVIARPLGPLYAVVAGTFVTPEAARAAVPPACLSKYFVRPARDLGMSGSQTVLSAITTRQSWAENALKASGECAGAGASKIATVTLPLDTP
jgi:hypothetical protein